jgi:hypothetical protein
VRYAVKTLVRRPQDSLAAWVSELGAGSPCFCCGSPLRDSPSEARCGSADGSSLICPVCGAGVVDDTSVALPATFTQRTRGLAAA